VPADGSFNSSIPSNAGCFAYLQMRMFVKVKTDSQSINDINSDISEQEEKGQSINFAGCWLVDNMNNISEYVCTFKNTLKLKIQ